MNCSAARREATPASARNFCKREFNVELRIANYE
jgi:hypothetical protein